MLFQDIQTGAMPVVDVGGNQPRFVQSKFTPTRDRDVGLPGQGSIPAQGPVGADLVAVALDIMEIHVAVTKEGLHQADHLAIAIDAPKFAHRVFEIDIPGVDAVSLVHRKAGIIIL